MASRSPDDLHPSLKPLLVAFLKDAKRAGIDVLITCTYRSNEEQATLYAQGRTAPGRVVTNAKPGQSQHNCTLPNGRPGSRAFDVVPLKEGKPNWDAGHQDWQTLGEIGTALGLEWAGDWKRMREYPHFQLPAEK